MVIGCNIDYDISLFFILLSKGCSFDRTWIKHWRRERSALEIFCKDLIAVDMSGENSREILRDITETDHIVFVSKSVVYWAYLGSFEAVVDAKNMSVTVISILLPSCVLEDFGKLGSYVIPAVGKTGERYS